uniref:Uncharacterized protein n=1 Tax=Megaselia scalaris TaxID=36166 RepID=T1GLN3_MEGSC
MRFQPFTHDECKDLINDKYLHGNQQLEIVNSGRYTVVSWIILKDREQQGKADEIGIKPLICLLTF